MASKSTYLSSMTRLQNALRDAVLLLLVAMVALCIAGCKSETSNEVTNHEKSNPQNSHERYKWVNSGGSFGASPLRQYIGLGKAERIVKLGIYWPTSDLTQQFMDVPLDSFLNVKEGEKQYQQLPYTALDLN